MKFTATVGARTLTNLEGLLRAFHSEGGRESKFKVEGMDVTMEVDFRQIPKRIIKAITFCKIKEFSYNDARLDSLVGATMKVQLLKENLGEANKIRLICGFFNEFNPDSSLVISNGEATISKFIRPSIAIIEEAGLQYAFNLSKAKEDFDEPEKERAEESLDESEQEVKAEETADESKQEVEVEKTAEQPKQDEKVKTEETADKSKQEVEVEETSDQPKQDEKEEISAINARHKYFHTIPELNRIAEESASYQEFVSSIIEKFELGKRQNLFANLIKAAEHIESTISWGNLLIALEDNGIEFNNSDKNWITRRVRDKFRNREGSAVTALSLINAIVEYKTFDFIREKEEKTVVIKVELTEEPQTEQEIAKKEKSNHLKHDDVEEKSSAEHELKEAEEKNTEIGGVTPNTGKVRMECMPEIPAFEDILKSVDKTQSPQEKAKYILEKMGLIEKNEKEKQYIIAIVSIALETGINDLRSICEKTKIAEKSYVFAQMTFSKFINEYVKRFCPNNKVIKGSVFLKELNELV